jgi:hypothetical protein
MVYKKDSNTSAAPSVLHDTSSSTVEPSSVDFAQITSEPAAFALIYAHVVAALIARSATLIPSDLVRSALEITEKAVIGAKGRL